MVNEVKKEIENIIKKEVEVVVKKEVKVEVPTTKVVKKLVI